MLLIPGGDFTMGSSPAEQERVQKEGVHKGWTDLENPQRSVNIRRFELGKYEVTQGQWKAVMGSNPSRFSNCGDNCPVEMVSWNDIQEYIQKLNQMTGQQYRLPSEAEWEYAARAGCTTDFNVGGQCRAKIEASEANFNGNYTYNSSAKGVYRNKTLPVGGFHPNTFGLYDMHGNVGEWVQDVRHDNYSGAPTDGSAWTAGGDQTRRVSRGHSYVNRPVDLRSAHRAWYVPDDRSSFHGFRLARTVP